MRPITVIGNWKMNGSFASNADWVKTVCRGMEQGMPAGRKYVVCAPAPYLSQCGDLIRDCSLAFLSLGAQDASAYPAGAYTGDVAAAMLKEFDCSYVIVGHSERRQYHHEADEQVAEKALQVLDNGMIPVICVGESADERNSGREVEVVRGQISKQVAILQDRLADCLIAYEPVWAIGTGKVASAQIAQDMHRAIRLQLAEFDEDVASHVGILYGGSVKPDNAVELFAMPDIDGGLIGGASLNPQDFLAICQA
ncbi:triose-phosphate isomerase [Polynucleobacter sp. JS-Mosq-20-D10]|uniref:triose-phosphate isomerase n=1 Tax=Polynucleobacter sp. JS-Mosq-20-D10 TaxID=2576922 RepID=UPI001BFD215A|nr:triose-phosphate isomerase [Polynucleobacter sp. JS-Mosq-20-D10]QWE01204.1 triose-phosphate isomerase [Polynucleobacter sp. JS-Mosq-20-D10]